jgi:hypothetical protein
MKTKFTKTELVTQWLASYPQDKNDPDLEFNAVAGYVETKDGMFSHCKDWAYEKHGPLKPTEDV